jgi:tripartite-type tricarboxylate transporter receptor subunit TctC
MQCPLLASASILMAVNPRVPATTVRGLVEAAKADPKSLANYGSAGVGTVFHLTGQLFNELTGLTLQHVPYRGGAPTVTALLAGEIPLAFETTLSLTMPRTGRDNMGNRWAWEIAAVS